MQKENLLKRLKSGLIVSCQALSDEPLHSSYIMSRMAVAAQEGGAVGIRANSGADIQKIKGEVNLPVIGIVKRVYEDSPVFITPSMDEVDEIVHAGADIIALDATNRMRPGNMNLKQFYSRIRKCYPDVLLMADISTFEEAVAAYQLGFDIVATTLSGNTPETKVHPLPDLLLVKKMVQNLDIPVFAEGGIWEPADMQTAFDYGAHTCIIGSAITRPQLITRRFVNHIQMKKAEKH
ncbi:N-acetylmannosamine-6-phosphate 2-epimerase [Virgibacillus ihumii]|uniref:N-acetylmannosamine-6-phosphate 2-epimerase n=1 Tax=Virgibacillus ihumii TaxID=2686091 RepID=UPI00157C6ED3|nr:N-acetylmannosamine-6-phosphate 2-epimerase [Virgibacillus ihumii]